MNRNCVKCGSALPPRPPGRPGRAPRYCVSCAEHRRVDDADLGPPIPLDGVSDYQRRRERAQRVVKAYRDGLEREMLNERFGPDALSRALHTLGLERA